jgi:hypothetical protein
VIYAFSSTICTVFVSVEGSVSEDAMNRLWSHRLPISSGFWRGSVREIRHWPSVLNRGSKLRSDPNFDRRFETAFTSVDGGGPVQLPCTQ